MQGQDVEQKDFSSNKTMRPFKKHLALATLVTLLGIGVTPLPAHADCTMTNDTVSYVAPAENMTSAYSSTQVLATCDGYGSYISIGIKNAGGAPPDYTLELWSDDGSDNPDALIGTTDGTLGAGIGTTCGLQTLTFSATVPITNGSLYWVTMHTASPSGYPNDLVWCNDGIASTYWYRTSSDGTSWTSSDPGMYAIVGITTDPPGGGGGGGGGSATTTTSEAPADRQEVLFVFGIIVFLLGVPFWDRTLTVSHGAWDV